MQREIERGKGQNQNENEKKKQKAQKHTQPHWNVCASYIYTYVTNGIRETF